jgi:adenylate cyclase
MPVRAVVRKLTAILAADVAGYSRLMGADEGGTLQRPTACRVIVDGLIAAHRGRIFNTAGDSAIADFANAAMLPHRRSLLVKGAATRPLG